MKGRFFALLPARCIVLKKVFEVVGQSRRAIRIAQFVNDHRRGVRLAQKCLRDASVTINAHGIDRADTAARDRCDGETAILAARREQLHRVADVRDLSVSARREPMMTEFGLLRKSSKLPSTSWCARSVVWR